MPCPSGWWPFGRCIVVFSFLEGGGSPTLLCYEVYFGVIILKIGLRTRQENKKASHKNVP